MFVNKYRIIHGLLWITIFCHKWGDSAMTFTSGEVAPRVTKKSLFTVIHTLFHFFQSWTHTLAKNNHRSPISPLRQWPWWRHDMETFSALLAICAGNLPVTDEFPSQRPVTRGALIFSLINVWTNGCVNNRDAGDLRRHRAYYDVNIMIWVEFPQHPSWRSSESVQS